MKLLQAHHSSTGSGSSVSPSSKRSSSASLYCINSSHMYCIIYSRYTFFLAYDKGQVILYVRILHIYACV